MKVLLTIVFLTLFFVSSGPLLAVERPGETSSPRAITFQEYCSFLNASQKQECEILDYYNEKMSEGHTSVLRLGRPGSYEYQAATLESSSREEASLSFLSKQEAGLFCDWCNISEQSQYKKWEIIESPRETHADVALHSNQLHFHLKSNEALHDPSTIVETMIEPELVETMASIIKQLLFEGALIVAGERAVNAHSRISTLEQTRHEHSESLSSASLKRPREEAEEAKSSLSKRLRSEESHGNLQGMLVEKITDSVAQKRALDIPGENTSPLSKIQKLGEGSSSSSDFQNIKNMTSRESHSSAHNDRFKAPTEKVHYRLGENGWEERSPSAAGNGLEGQWEKTDHFEKDYLGEGTRKVALKGELLLHKNVDPIFIQNHSRDGIANKIKFYSDELKKPETQQTQKEIEKFTNLISVLTAARNYQDSIIGHLANSATSLDPKIKALQRLSRISEAMKLNERPNKIEVLAEKLEHDYTQLAIYQESVQVLQIEIDQQAEPMDHLLEAMDHQSDLIKARVARATLIRPPYETLSEKQQADLSANKWLCIEKEALARSEELEAQDVVLSDHGEDLERAVNIFKRLANEAKKKPNPNQQIIDLLIKSANFYEQAIEAHAAGQFQKVEYLSDAGWGLDNAALEADEPNSNPETSKQIIDLYTQAASMFQLAAKAIDEGQDKKAEYLSDAGWGLDNAALEAQKPTSNPETSKQIIDLYTQAASMLQLAAKAIDEGQNIKAIDLNYAGSALFDAVSEAQKRNPNQQIIQQKIEVGIVLSKLALKLQKTDTKNRALSERFDMDMVKFDEGARDAFDDDYVGTLFNDAAQAYRSSISAEETGDTSAATSWRDIGNHYRDAAKECKDFLEKNNLTPQDERFDTFLDQSTDGRPTIREQIEEAISIRNDLPKSKKVQR